ncbi:hypothetical protein ACVWY0_000941 [Arthrobacter sp. UYNi723]
MNTPKAIKGLGMQLNHFLLQANAHAGRTRKGAPAGNNRPGLHA